MYDCPREKVELWEDFTRDNVTNLNENATGSADDQDITARHGGWWRMDSGGTDDESLSLCGELAWEVDEGHPLIFETRLVTSDSDVSCIFVGMTDAVDDVIIIADEGGSLNTVATDAFGLLLEGETTTVPVLAWQAVAVDTNVDEVQTVVPNSTSADDVVQTLRMEANPNDSGTVYHFIDGKLELTKTNWFDSSLVYCPALAIDDRNTQFYADFDYLYVCAPRS